MNWNQHIVNNGYNFSSDNIHIDGKISKTIFLTKNLDNSVDTDHLSAILEHWHFVIDPFPAICDKSCLLSRLLMYFDSLHCILQIICTQIRLLPKEQSDQDS